MDGKIDVGYEINRKTKFCLRLGKGSVIGAYNCTFNKKALFKYQISNTMKAYTIRKLAWFQHINDPDYNEISVLLKKNIDENYHQCIKDRIIFIQNGHMRKLGQRTDQKEIMTIVDVKSDKTILSV